MNEFKHPNQTKNNSRKFNNGCFHSLRHASIRQWNNAESKICMLTRERFTTLYSMKIDTKLMIATKFI